MTRWCELCEQHHSKCRCTLTPVIPTKGPERMKCDNCEKKDPEGVQLCTKCQIAPYKEIDSWRQKWSVATAAKVAVEGNLSGLITEVTSLPHYEHCTITTPKNECSCPLGMVLQIIEEMPCAPS